jgi:hypothetical protein
VTALNSSSALCKEAVQLEQKLASLLFVQLAERDKHLVNRTDLRRGFGFRHGLVRSDIEVYHFAQHIRS